MSIKRSLSSTLATALVALLGLLVLTPAPALASRSQVSIFADDTSLVNNASATLQELRHLGIQIVRVGVRWSYIAPNPASRRKPRFNASDPNAYPASGWSFFDTVVRDATADGIKVLFMPTGFAPFWAQGPNPGRYAAHYNIDEAFEPSASDFGQFVRAVATRYSGHFTPRGSLKSLPRVSYWELYNEPNFGEDLAPQAINRSTIPTAPRMYRGLANAAWSALHGTGHGRDTILIGSFAGGTGASGPPSRGAPQGYPGTYGSTKALAFTRELYCLTPNYSRYLGGAAAARGCPTTTAGYRRFRAQNPALFQITGFSDHPYPQVAPPTRGDSADPGKAQFNQLPNFASTIDRVQRAYGSRARLPIWNTEYGYITCPPTCSHRGHPKYISPATAAQYINQAEYLSWLNPRIATTMQYLLYDPNPTLNTPEYGGFASGLIYYPTILGGQPKQTYFAYRLPIFLPKTSARLGNTLQVWGDVRTAPRAVADGDGPQFVQIEFQASPGGQWVSEKTVRVTDSHGYFQASVAFPSSGSVRIAWSYPPTDVSLASNLVTPGQTVGPNGYFEPLAATTSRTVKITLT